MHDFSSVILQYTCGIPMPERSLGPLTWMNTDIRFECVHVQAFLCCSQTVVDQPQAQNGVALGSALYPVRK